MNFELKIRNIVAVGGFNPMVFDKYFFVTNGIVSENDLNEKTLFLPEQVQLITSKFHLTINNLQIIINAIQPENTDCEIALVMSKILEKGSHFSRVSASGFNFKWFLSDIELDKYTKNLCFNPANKIQNTFFKEEDATFGFYSSKSIMNTRLKLDVKPIRYWQTGMDSEQAALQFEFNFHKDYKEPETANEEFQTILTNYIDYQTEAQKIITTLD